MRILIVLTYYRPHTSGLTIYAERLAKALVKRGHQVTVLTSQYDPSLAQEEVQDGVKIVRAPVLFRVSKGVIMPTFGYLASKLVMQHDVIQLHLPQFDAAGISLRGRFLRKPTVVTYHCDLRMPPGLLSQASMWAVRIMNNLTALFTHSIVTYTRDYAEHSSYLRKYLSKTHIIPPPVELPAITDADVNHFHAAHNPENRQPVIGMAARFATEKGVEVLLNAMPYILKIYPQALVLFAGPYQNIIGEEDYIDRLMPAIRSYQESGNWKFLGNLNSEQIASFYRNLDILVLPSLNSTEAFGLVQIEAMINGVPVVASDLPGVRQPAKRHQMGKIIPIGDSKSLAESILEILKNPQAYRQDPDEIARQYDPDSVATDYEELFNSLLEKLH